MKVVRIENLSLEEKKVLMHLRNNVFPFQFGHAAFEEFDLYLDSLIEAKHYLLKDENQIGGWAFTFFRDQEVWFSIMINNQIQGKGNGTKLIEELKRNNFNLNGWVIDHENDIMQNGEVYKSPLLFYIKNGFNVYQNTRIENEKIKAVKINWTKKK